MDKVQKDLELILLKEEIQQIRDEMNRLESLLAEKCQELRERIKE